LGKHLSGGAMRRTHMDAIGAQRQHYRGIATEFDVRYNRDNANHLYKIEEIGRSIFDLLPAKGGGYDVLELGGGSGIHASYFLRNHQGQIRSFTLSDLSPEMLDQARKRLAGLPVTYLASEAENIRSRQSFDAIYVSGAMHHFASPQASIQSMWEHLRPGGVVAICEPNVWNPINFVKAMKDYSLEKGQFKVTRRNIHRMLTEQGFRVSVSRVLHWRGGLEIARLLWPYRRLESIRALNYGAVMFLLVGAKPDPRPYSPN
jgi:ubiquinone/menaquinone biosynthesis C-methylase UbiE